MAAQGMPTQYVEGLRLSERERTVLIEQMKKSGAADKRKHPRLVVQGTFSLLCCMEFPGGSSANFRLYPWDLSKGGLSFFHRAYIYQGTKCTFTGNTIDGQPTSFKGEVVRCSHVSGTVHTVGVKLDLEIEPEDFVGDVSHQSGPAPAAAVALSNERSEEWWSHVLELAREVVKQAESHAPVEAIKKTIVALVQEANNNGGKPAPHAAKPPTDPDQSAPSHEKAAPGDAHSP